MAVYHPIDVKDEWDLMTWLLLVHKISFRRTIRVIRYLTIVTILKSWNSCPKGTNWILRIGLGSHEFGVPLLVSSSLSMMMIRIALCILFCLPLM
jgi:hypothetical protein